MAIAHPLNWINQVEASLLELEEKPQFGFPSSFDWHLFEKHLQDLFEKPHLTLTHSVKGWQTADQIGKGLGGKVLTLSIEWTPIGAPCFFVTNQQNLKELMAELFEEEKVAAFFYDTSLVEGFYNYFATEILNILEKEQFAPPLAPRLSSQHEQVTAIIGEESCFVIDVSLSLGKKNFWGRVLLPERFRQEWKSYFAHLGPPKVSEEMLQKLNVDLAVEVGHTRLSLEEWRSVKSGDFILLDHCSYDPSEHKGGGILNLRQTPIFRGRFKENGIKITNYPVYEEVNTSMEEESFESEEEDIYGDLGEEEEETFEEEEEEEALESPEAPAQAPAEEKPFISPEELPIHLTVEVARLRMTASELMNLAPGNLLELTVSPEQGVDLVVNGKKVGRGELIRMGDVLGVRILTL